MSELTLTPSQIERLMPLSRAAERMRGRGGRPPNPRVVARWTREGCRVAGQVIKLNAVLISGCLLTLPEWVETFEQTRARAALAARRPPLAEPAPRTRRASKRAADAYLQKMGVKV